MTTMHARALLPVTLPHPSPLPSPWQSPRRPLQTHRAPTTPPAPYTIAIIGTGITGALTAYQYLRSHSEPGSATGSRPRIALLDAREPCSGATGRNGGHTKAGSYRNYLRHRAAHGVEDAARIVRVEEESIGAVHALARELGVSEECESWTGRTVDAVYDPGAFEEGKRAIEILVNECGDGAGYRVLGREEAVRRYGVESVVEVEGRKEELVGAFEYQAGSLHAYRFTMAVLARCVELGAEVYAYTPVAAITPLENAVSRVDAAETVPRYALKTPGADILAHTVIVATNAYTAALLPQFQTVIVPLRGQVTAQRPGLSKLPKLGATYSFIYKGGYEYMIPRTVRAGDEQEMEQQIIIGGGLARLPQDGASEYGTVDDSEANPSISRYLAAVLPAYFGLERPDVKVQYEWTGIMGATRDGLPFVGEIPAQPGLWVAAGFNGHGMVLCAKSAEALVKMINGEEVEWFPRCFNICDRLKEGTFDGRMDLGGCGVGSVERQDSK